MSQEDTDGAKKNDYFSATSNEVEPEQGKRQCTAPCRSGTYAALGEIPASPPKFVSLEELMKAANGVKNMVLAHEIAINKDFKLEKLEAPQNSLEKKVEDVVHKAFWDVLESELAEDPPNYTQAMLLLNDIKNGLLALLLPQHTKIHQQISEVLDVDLIKQQANAGTLDFQQYAQYVISVMGKLCAPVRDERIASLTKTANVVEVFKGILETIDLMKLDMANFTINLMRPQIVANSVQYERKKFSEYLKFDQDGLLLTRQWLKRHLQVADEHSDLKKKITAVINDAYLELLEWNEEIYELPEIAVMDKGRILDLKKQFNHLTLAGAILLLTFAQSGPDLCSIDDFKQKLKHDILILLKNIESQEDLTPVLFEVAEKLKSNLQSAIEQYNIGGSQVNPGNLNSQLAELKNNDHKIINLLKQRIREFLLTTITSQTAEPMKIPPGFSSFQQEVAQLAGSFLRLTSHNRAVYEEYYTKILEECLK